MKWNIVETGPASAQENMEKDQKLFIHVDRPTLHFYEWRNDSATYGYFVDPANFLNLSSVASKNLDIARRPTGGGIVFHIWDFAFSVIVPSSCPLFSRNTLENYKLVNQGVLQTVQYFLNGKNFNLIPNDELSWDKNCERFCMARPTKYDVVLEGKKIAGAAQRRDKNGFLHQGSIAILPPDEPYLSEILLPGTKVVEAMQNFTYPLLSSREGKKELLETKKILRELLEKYFNELS